MSSKWKTSRDVNMKIYSVVPHPFDVEVLIAATSVGVIVLKIGSTIDTDRHIGTHPTWQANNMVLTFNESTCQKCFLSMQGGLLSVKDEMTVGREDSVGETEDASRRVSTRIQSARPSSSNFSK
jgi:hypothetical protein